MAKKLKICQEIFDLIYPIGSIYISINTTNPSTLFGGTWERIKGKFLLGADDNNYANGTTGGEATHTLTIDEIPEHKHYGFMQSDVPYVRGSGSSYGLYISGSYGNGFNTSSDRTGTSGNGQEHNNMPPYLAVHIWKRTN